MRNGVVPGEAYKKRLAQILKSRKKGGKVYLPGQARKDALSKYLKKTK